MVEETLTTNFKIILLAAGLSTRMNGENKLLKDYKGTALVNYSLNTALSVTETIIVLGHQKEELLSSLKVNEGEHQLKPVVNENYKDGQYSSTLRGLMQLEDGFDFAIIPADIPFVTREDYLFLLKQLDGADIVRPFVNGTPGHPVLFKAHLRRPIIEALEQKRDMKKVLSEFETRYKILNLDCSDRMELVHDFDTKEAFDKG